MANPCSASPEGIATSKNQSLSRQYVTRLTLFVLHLIPSVVLLLILAELWVWPSSVLADDPPFSLSWSSIEYDNTTSLAWGDYDGDGDLDLAMGHRCYFRQGEGGWGGPPCHGGGLRLYRNDRGSLTINPVSSLTEPKTTTSLAWGDYDADGDLDLAVGNLSMLEVSHWHYGGPRLYQNEGGILTATAVWSLTEIISTMSVVWGDYDGDSDLDLAVGNYDQPNQLYRNDNGMLRTSAAWSSTESNNTTSLAWGDYDRDGDLDLAVGNYGQSNRLYRNDNGMLRTNATWFSTELDNTTSVAWGDYDRDGDLDLVAGNYGQANRLYRNDNGMLTPGAAWFSTETDNTASVAWGDYDGDGNLDLAVGNTGQPNRIYRNQEGVLVAKSAWSSIEDNITRSVGWGDYDSDGDLDLAIGNGCDEDLLHLCKSNQLYRNDGDILIGVATQSLAGFDEVKDVAWGDYDGDGDLDLAVGNYGPPNQLYRNDNGVLTNDAVWFSSESDNTTSVAWGDYDRDGDLDLAVGNYDQPDRLYQNQGRLLTVDAVQSSDETAGTIDVAWGDYDSDGNLDLVVGGTGYAPPLSMTQASTWRLYSNKDGDLTFDPAQSSLEFGATASLAWGDYDNDGDLDLGVGNNSPFVFDFAPIRLYCNDKGALTGCKALQPLTEVDVLKSMAWGDFDSDGDLDLAIGNYGQPNRLYRNDNGSLATEPVWSSTESDDTTSIAWGDYEGDGDLDLAVGNYGQPNRLYRNDNGVLTNDAAWFSAESDNTTSMAWGDYDGDGDLDLIASNDDQPIRLYCNVRIAGHRVGSVPVVQIPRPKPPCSADFYSSPTIWFGPNIPLTYTLSQPDSLPVRRVVGLFSLNGGGQWFPAIAANGTVTTNLSTSPEGTSHTYTWDLFHSGVMGQSDNVVFRLQAIPAIVNRPNGVPGPYLYGSYATDTFPFRVRGGQVRVLSGTTPISNALVYRLPEGQNGGGQPYADLAGQPFHTDGQGYLPGRGELHPGDRLLALRPVSAPITWTNACTMYHTNGTPTPVGLDAFNVTAPGVQTITVSAAHPLLLCDLHVSLEWNAGDNPTYLSQLTSDLKGASRYLYDFTDGQVALKEVVVHQNGDQWVTSDVVIYATNRMRPLAVQGGLVLTDTADRGGLDLVYEMGQVRMGATWNQFGDPSDDSRDDWQRALAHELAHYLLFQEDTYLGLNDTGLLIPVGECTGSAMGDFYTEANTEFLDDADWLPKCGDTLAHRTLNRSEWATLRAWYSGLAAGDNAGPSVMPFDLTTINVLDSVTPTATLGDVTFFIDYAADSSSPGARAFLLRGDETGEYVTDLGIPATGQDRVLARGVREGDRLCVFDPPRSQYGCETVSFGDDHLALAYDPAWTPLIRVSPVETNSLRVEVGGLGGAATLQAQLYPEYGYATEPIGLAYSDGSYSGLFDDLPYPPVVGHVRVWNESLGQEAMTSYIIGGNPGENPFSRGHGPFSRGHGPFSRGHGPFSRGHGPFYRGSGAFVVSPDGQMSLFTQAPDFEEGDMYTIQTMVTSPPLPPDKTAIGSAYRLVSTGTPVSGDASISFQYLGVDALREGVDENDLRIHFWDGEEWQVLDTVVDAYYNMASAWSQGDGVYALLAGVTLPRVEAVIPSSATNELTRTLVISGGYFLAPVQVALVGPTATYTLPLEAVSPLSVTVVVTQGLPAHEYGVRVVNGDGGVSPAPGTFALYEPAPVDACFYDFFESGAGQWARSGDWEIAILPDGERAMTDSPTGPYKNAGDYGTEIATYTTAITSQAFNLAACTNPTLTFRHDYVIAQVGASRDAGRVEISTDGGVTWTELASFSGGGVFGEGMETQDVESPEWADVEWEMVEIGLDAYTGTARLRFSLEVNDDAITSKGWIIDDVIVASDSGAPVDNTDVFLPIILKEE